LVVRDSRGEKQTIRPTGRHRFFRETDGQWVAASGLRQGDVLRGHFGTLEVLENKRVAGTHRVYNMTVEGEHVYHVSTLGVLTHNSCRGSAPAILEATTPIGDLRRAGQRDAHHVIQDAAIRDIPGYNTNAAPGVRLDGPANVPGTPHNATRAVQREMGGGTYAAERRIGYKALRRAGYTPEEARRAIQEADDYFRSIGVGPTTPTRIPGDRR
jgi:hypothetical protein